MTNYCLGHIDIDEPGQEAKLEAEISKVFHSYLNNIDQDCLGLSDKSIINTHASEGVAVSTTSPHFGTFFPQNLKNCTKVCFVPPNPSLDDRLTLFLDNSCYIPRCRCLEWIDKASKSVSTIWSVYRHSSSFDRRWCRSSKKWSRLSIGCHSCMQRVWLFQHKPDSSSRDQDGGLFTNTWRFHKGLLFWFPCFSNLIYGF